MIGNEMCVASLGPLTPREAEALLWVAEGKTAWEAGTILGITEATTNAHIASAAIKLNATNRPNLVARAFIEGILCKVIRALIFSILLAQAVSGQSDMIRGPRKIAARRWREETAMMIHVLG